MKAPPFFRNYARSRRLAATRPCGLEHHPCSQVSGCLPLWDAREIDHGRCSLKLEEVPQQQQQKQEKIQPQQPCPTIIPVWRRCRSALVCGLRGGSYLPTKGSLRYKYQAYLSLPGTVLRYEYISYRYRYLYTVERHRLLYINNGTHLEQ